MFGTTRILDYFGGYFVCPFSFGPFIFTFSSSPFFLGFAFYMLPIISYQFNFVLEPKGITVKLPSTTLELR